MAARCIIVPSAHSPPLPSPCLHPHPHRVCFSCPDWIRSSTCPTSGMTGTGGSSRTTARPLHPTLTICSCVPSACAIKATQSNIQTPGSLGHCALPGHTRGTTAAQAGVACGPACRHCQLLRWSAHGCGYRGPTFLRCSCTNAPTWKEWLHDAQQLLGGTALPADTQRQVKPVQPSVACTELLQTLLPSCLGQPTAAAAAAAVVSWAGECCPKHTC